MFYKNFGSKKNFGSEKILGWKTFESEKILKLWVYKKSLGLKKCFTKISGKKKFFL